jgi:hypothetical protein
VLQAHVQLVPETVHVPWPHGSLTVPLVAGLHSSTHAALEVPGLEAVKPASQLHVWPVLGAAASVQVAPASPLLVHGLLAHSFKSLQVAVPVPV